jgi:hypothetical protein
MLSAATLQTVKTSLQYNKMCVYEICCALTVATSEVTTVRAQQVWVTLSCHISYSGHGQLATFNHGLCSSSFMHSQKYTVCGRWSLCYLTTAVCHPPLLLCHTCGLHWSNKALTVSGNWQLSVITTPYNTTRVVQQRLHCCVSISVALFCYNSVLLLYTWCHLQDLPSVTLQFQSVCETKYSNFKG